MKFEKKIIFFYAYLPFCILGIYLGYTYFSKKTSSNEQFFDAPLLMILDSNLTIINEWKRIGGNKFIVLKFSKNIDENLIKKVLLQKNWKIKKTKPLILSKDKVSCEINLSNSNSIEFIWK